MKQKMGLKTENLSVGYGKKILLFGVELDVIPGTVLTLIGPNGSGKSTILKTLTRQLKSMEGRILFMDFSGQAENAEGEELEKMAGAQVA